MSNVYSIVLSFLIFIGFVITAFSVTDNVLQVSSQATIDTVSEQTLTTEINNGTSRFNVTNNIVENIDKQAVIDYLQANSYNNGDSDITTYYNQVDNSYLVEIDTREIQNTYKVEVK